MLFAKTHEWAKIEGSSATVGITDHAQDALGDVVYVELPKVGRKLKQGEEFGVVESVKTVSSLYAPLSGEVTEVNAGLNEKPAQVNDDPQGQGWMIKLKIDDPAEAKTLFSAEDYEKSLH